MCRSIRYNGCVRAVVRWMTVFAAMPPVFLAVTGQSATRFDCGTFPRIDSASELGQLIVVCHGLPPASCLGGHPSWAALVQITEPPPQIRNTGGAVPVFCVGPGFIRVPSPSRPKWRFSRQPKSQSEIATCGGFTRPALVAFLAERGVELSAETLVHLVRAEGDAGDVAMIRLCGQLLVGRPRQDGSFEAGHCEPLIRKMAIMFGLGDDPDALKDFRAACHQGMWRAVRAGTLKKPFWERDSFWH